MDKSILKYIFLKGIHIVVLVAIAVVSSLPAFSQEKEDANTGFYDGIDRMAEDFVIASVCIADPVDWEVDLLGTLGHSFIRLQCPTFDLDQCFSYESDNMKEDLPRFFKGEMKMGMFNIPTEEYLADYKTWKRAVHEYKLNLPPEVETRLWEIMDDQVKLGADFDFDLMRRGCTQTIVGFVKKALDGTPIVYGEWPERFSMTRRQLINEEMKAYPWMMLFGSDLLISQGFGADCYYEEKIVIPSQLPEVWTKATVNGVPLLTYKGDLVAAEPVKVEAPLVTPLMVAVAILVLVIALAFTRIRAVDWAVLILQFLVGLLCCWLQLVSALPGGLALWLLPLYNPLPLLLWKKRNIWAVPYACMLVAWILVVSFNEDVYVDNAHLVLALSVVVIMLREKCIEVKKESKQGVKKETKKKR